MAKSLPPAHILRVTIPLHLAALASAVWLFQSGRFAWTDLLWTFVGWILISGFGVAVGYHRLLSHRSFSASIIMTRILAALGALGAQGSPQFWVAIHNGVHHRFADGERDLHSPVLGLWSSYFGWQCRLKPEDVPFRAALTLQADPFLRFLHRHYTKVIWMPLFIAAAVNLKLAIFFLLFPMVISIHQENIINCFSHVPACGYRNFQTPDRSVNSLLLGLLFFDQGFHNNHHARPNEYDFGSVRWYELDSSRFLVSAVRALSRLSS